MIQYEITEETNFTELEELHNFVELFRIITDNKFWEDIETYRDSFIRDEMGLENHILSDLTIDEEEIIDILLSYDEYIADYIEYMTDAINECLDEYNDQSRRWKEINYINLKGQLHREDGPAVEYHNSDEDRFFLNDDEYTEKEYWKKNRRYKLTQILD